MKKAVALLLALTLALGVTACGGQQKDDTEGKSAQNILQDAWAAHAEDEKFAVIGGDYENMTENDAGTASIEDGEVLDSMFGFPADSVGLIDDAASLMHMMNQNTFTAAAYHVKDAADVEDLGDEIKEHILERQWMCGFPETLIVYKVGQNFVVSAFGNGELIDTFETHLSEAYGSAELLHVENLEF